MNDSKFNKVQEIASAFNNFDVYASNIVVQHGSMYDPKTSGQIETFSRYTWENDESAIFYGAKNGAESPDSYLVRFFLKTLTIIGLGDSVPDEEDIPEERIVGTIAIEFNVEYALSTDPSKIDSESLSVIERIKVFNDAYPFWREALQSLAMRAKLPVPVLPAQRPAAMLLSLVAPLHLSLGGPKKRASSQKKKQL